MKNDKIVLAFSGGLYTSYCVKYLMHEKQFDVYSAIVNTGGFSESELIEIKEKAISLGVVNHETLEETQVKKDTSYPKLSKTWMDSNLL